MMEISAKLAAPAGVALAIAGMASALAMTSARAAPPSGVPTFASAAIAVEARGESAGGLTCRWRETGVGSSQVVYYACGAGAVGVLKACVFKNRLIYASPTRLDVFKSVLGGEHGGTVPFLSQKNGQISAAATTEIPHVETGVELCSEPSVETVVAVRWCNATLSDVTNGLIGATAAELFQQFISGGGSVPDCPSLLAAP